MTKKLSILSILSLASAFETTGHQTQLAVNPYEYAFQYNDWCDNVARNTHNDLSKLIQSTNLPKADKVALIEYSEQLRQNYVDGTGIRYNPDQLSPNQQYILGHYIYLPKHIVFLDNTPQSPNIPQAGTPEFDAAVDAGEIFPPEDYYEERAKRRINPESYLTPTQIDFIRNRPTWTTQGIVNTFLSRTGGFKKDQQQKLQDNGLTLAQVIEEVRKSAQQ